jgi:hypothetical protein
LKKINVGYLKIIKSILDCVKQMQSYVKEVNRNNISKIKGNIKINEIDDFIKHLRILAKDKPRSPLKLKRIDKPKFKRIQSNQSKDTLKANIIIPIFKKHRSNHTANISPMNKYTKNSINKHSQNKKTQLKLNQLKRRAQSSAEQMIQKHSLSTLHVQDVQEQRRPSHFKIQHELKMVLYLSTASNPILDESKISRTQA